MAGRSEATGRFALRDLVNFLRSHCSAFASHPLFGVAPMPHPKTLKGRKDCSRNARSQPPATFPLPREAALCFNISNNVKQWSE